jgi:glutathione-regulated potassium-efflux system ancillary protein KefF
MICVILAHPYPHQSHVNRVLADALRGLPDLDLRALYDLYPDFDIDVAAEQSALEQAALVVWMHPVYWYSVPALMKHWFDKVLAFGFAYGEGGNALAGKHCFWVPSTGGKPDDFAPEGLHAQPFEAFVAPIEYTARFCGMTWEPPYIVHGANAMDERAAIQHATALTQRLSQWRDTHVPTTAGLTP